MQNGYFYSRESETFTFLRVPKALLTSERYKGLSGDGVLLYSLMVDRVNLSRQNNWVDEQGRIYIYFTIDEIMATFGFAKAKACSLLAKICDMELAEKKPQGQGKPNILYPKKFEC